MFTKCYVRRLCFQFLLIHVKAENGDSIYLRDIVYILHISTVERPKSRIIINKEEPEISKFTDSINNIVDKLVVFAIHTLH
jgi:hypothetical protein